MNVFRLFSVSPSRIPPKHQNRNSCVQSFRIEPFPINLPKGLENTCKTRVECWKKVFLLLLLILLDKTQAATGFIDHPPSCSKLSAQQSDNGDGLACKWKSFNDTEKNNENHCFQIIYTAIEAFFFFFLWTEFTGELWKLPVRSKASALST